MKPSKILVTTLIAFCVTSPSVWAQAQARLLNEDASFLPWAIAGGLIVLIGVIAFINPKRSHLN